MVAMRSPAVVAGLLVTLTATGCAAWRAFSAEVAPVVQALMGVMESSGCGLHAAAGLPESDPRAVAIHEAGAAVDALLGAHTPTEAGALEKALGAFTAAVDAIKASLPPALPSAVLPSKPVATDTDGGAPPPIDPDGRPSPTLPLPPPRDAMVSR